jgi:hypothetical protein
MRWHEACAYRGRDAQTPLIEALAHGERSAPRCGQTRKTKDHHEREDESMKLTTMTQVTIDGVMQGEIDIEAADISL